jgi:predicted MFS family arabinose efflux permease
VWILFACYGIYYGLTEGVEKAFVADLVPSDKRGTAFGIYNGAIGISALPASVIAGLLWQYIGVSAPFLFGAALSIMAVVLLTVLMRK